MKFVISTQELNYLIGKIFNVVPQKPTMQILSNIYIEAANDELILTATDLTVGIRCNTEAKIIEEGSAAIPAKRFAQLVRELTSANIEISSAHEITTLISGTSRFKMNGMKKEEFPILPPFSRQPTLVIPQKDLKNLLYRTSFAISKEDTRYVLTGALMQIGQGQVSFVGTDGKRLAKAHLPIETPPDFSTQAILPSKAVDEIFKNLQEEGDASIFLLEGKIMVQINNTLIMSKLLVGDYPDFSRVIPENSDIIITLHRDELISLLRQISLFLPDPNLAVRFLFTDGELKITANTKEIGEGHVCMPVNYQGDKLEAAFNPGYFLDILRHCNEETVTLGMTDAYNPGIIADGEPQGKLIDSTPIFIIMPMRLSEE